MSFNPNQPRVPAGSSDGGQFAGGSGGSMADRHAAYEKSLSGDPAAFAAKNPSLMASIANNRKLGVKAEVTGAPKGFTEKALQAHLNAKADARMLERSRQIDAMQSAHAKITGQALNRQAAALKVASGQGPGFSRLPPLRSRKP